METNVKNLYSGKLVWGLALLTVSLFIELVLAGYSLATLGVEIDPSALASGQAKVNPVQIALGCLSPLGFVLKLVALVLIVQDSARLNAQTGGLHRRLVWAAAVAFAISLAAQLGSMLITITATTSGSLSSLQLALWISLVGSILGFAVTFMLIYFVMPRLARILLMASLVVYIAATAGSSAMMIQSTSLQKYEMMGRTFFTPVVGAARTEGIYPALAGAGTLALGLAFLTLLVPTISAWRSLRSELPESVA